MTKTEKMYDLMSRYEKSGLSRPEFCEEAGISLAKFAYWRRRWLKQKPGSNDSGRNLLAFEKARDCSPASAYELIYPNGVRLKMQELDLSLLPILLAYV